MFICQIHYQINNHIYLAGIRAALDKLASSNPSWGYQMIAENSAAQSERHLSITDLTGCKTVNDIGPQIRTDTPRSLLLMKASQKELISILAQEHRCSILCVDEMHFQMREVIESIMKKRRYLSQLASRYQTIALPVSTALLTRMECTILDHIWEGRSGVDISKALFRSEKTISTHKRSIMRKLNVTTDLELRKCIQHYDKRRVGIPN